MKFHTLSIFFLFSVLSNASFFKNPFGVKKNEKIGKKSTSDGAKSHSPHPKGKAGENIKPKALKKKNGKKKGTFVSPGRLLEPFIGLKKGKTVGPNPKDSDEISNPFFEGKEWFDSSDSEEAPEIKLPRDDTDFVNPFIKDDVKSSDFSDEEEKPKPPPKAAAKSFQKRITERIKTINPTIRKNVPKDLSDSDDDFSDSSEDTDVLESEKIVDPLPPPQATTTRDEKPPLSPKKLPTPKTKFPMLLKKSPLAVNEPELIVPSQITELSSPVVDPEISPLSTVSSPPPPLDTVPSDTFTTEFSENDVIPRVEQPSDPAETTQTAGKETIVKDPRVTQQIPPLTHDSKEIDPAPPITTLIEVVQPITPVTKTEVADFTAPIVKSSADKSITDVHRDDTTRTVPTVKGLSGKQAEDTASSSHDDEFQAEIILNQPKKRKKIYAVSGLVIACMVALFSYLLVKLRKLIPSQ